MVDESGSELVVWPVILRDMTGRVVSLRITSLGWEWRAHSTHLAFRSDHTVTVPDRGARRSVSVVETFETIASGAFTLKISEVHAVSVTFTDDGGLIWQINTPSETVGSTLTGDELALAEKEFGFGVKGASPSVRFAYVEMRE